MLSFVLIITLSTVYGYDTVNVDLFTDKIIHKTDDFYVSYTLDIANFFEPPVNLSSPQFHYMAKQLSPSVLRIGGTDGDYSYYFTTESGECEHVPSGYNCFTKDHLEMLMDYVSATKAKLIFALSAGYPLYPNWDSTSWNSTNAEVFLNYIVNNGYGSNFYAFELGNELNQDTPVSFQVGAFKQLKVLLQKIYGAKNLPIPKLMGPDPHSYTLRRNGSIWTWVEQFIHDACDLVDAFTYHSYVCQNSTSLLSYNGINEQYKESKRFSTAVTQNCINGTQKIYAGEIAEYNTGIDGLNNVFEDMLWYLDALGSIALLGQDGFFRQQIWGLKYHPNYSLLNTLEYTPLPDYWIALLFNRLMGTQVLNATTNDQGLRTYLHCFNNNGTPDGSVVLAFVNVKSNPIAMRINIVLGIWPNHMDYLITSKDNQLDTSDVYLNGIQLMMTDDNKIPDLKGKASTDNPIMIEKYSVGFVHFTDSELSICK